MSQLQLLSLQNHCAIITGQESFFPVDDREGPINAKITPAEHFIRLPRISENELFFDNREAAVINTGGAGSLSVDGVIYLSGAYSCTYIGKGSTDVQLFSDDPADPAVFIMISAKANFSYANHIVHLDEATPADEFGLDPSVPMFTYLRPDGIRSCQLQMGICVECDTGELAEVLKKLEVEQAFVYLLPGHQNAFLRAMVSGNGQG